MLRSLSAAVLALAICACEPSLPQVTPTPTVTAVFDPSAAKIPLPNDLVFAAPINTVCPAPGNAALAATDPPKCAQAELLATLAGKFPSDQEVPLTIAFTKNTYVDGRLLPVAPDLDLATITPATLAVVDSSGHPVELETPVAGDYVVLKIDDKPDDHGTLSVHRKGHVPWATDHYTLVLRGGDMGVKTKDTPAIPVTPSPVFALIEQGKDMTAPENLGLLKAQNNGSTEKALEQGLQLNLLIAIYKASAFPVADAVFGAPGAHTQMAIASTFQIDKTITNVTVDPARGLAPLPFDVLRDATTGKITAVAACSLAGGTLDAAGVCSQPAAAGFATLDGFSTTGAILAQTSAPINTTTVTSQTLKLYDLSDPKNPVEVPTDVGTGSLIREPCEFSAQFVPLPFSHCDTANLPPAAPVIAFQPAGASAGDPSSVFRTQPLKDNTDYAVVMTKGIKDLANNPIGPGTVAKILRFTNALSVGGHSALQGIDDVTAASLEKMRKQLAQMFTALGANAPADVAMAYTFHTQTVISPAVQLAALPYTQPSVTGLPKTNLTVETPDAAYSKFGISAAPHDKIDQILEADITTFNALDPATGAFLADPTKAAAETIHVLIATPLAAAAPLCQGLLTGFGHCAPLMVFRHGLRGGRAQMLLIANSFAAAGMVTVAIDAAKHGDRSLCSSGAPAGQSGCVGTCTALPMAAGQGDATPPGPPGTCDTMGLVKKDFDGNVITSPDKDGIAAASANYLISANFFRTRDTLRQDLIDESQLIRVMAFSPDPNKLPPNSGHAVLDQMVQRGVIIDPATVYFSGQSLGAIQGTLDVATNPRISKAGLNVGGGTIVDIFTNSPAFSTQIDALLLGLHITKGTPQYLQFLTVAKTILDPADPANFAGHITANNLPNLLTPLGGNPNGTIAQVPKKVLMQVAFCDQVVPNPFGLVWASNLAFAAARSTPPAAPLGPLPNDPAFFAPGATGQFQLFAGKDFTAADFATSNCTSTPRETAAGDVTGGGDGGHSLLLFSPKHPDLTAAAQASMVSFMTSTQPNPAVPSVVLAQ
jgi:hypothetical protein